jgi:hypothetical protein
MSRTPGPWHVAGRKGGWDGVTAEDGTDICALEYNNPANAAFIVRAVNAHDALVAALENLIPRFRNACRQNGSDADMIDEATRMHTEALALARQP